MIYRKFEFGPVQRPLSTFALLIVTPSLPAFLILDNYRTPFAALCTSFAIFHSTLISSIVVYRISPFHPLADYPGPLLAKISKFYGVYMISTGKNHILLKLLHEKYGPYVRIGKLGACSCYLN